MKPILTLFSVGIQRSWPVLWAVLFFALNGWGSDAKTGDPEGKEDVAAMRELLKMPKDDLARLRLSLEAIEKMSPEERRKALARIQNLDKEPTEQRKEAIDRWNELNPEMKKAYFDYVRKLSPSDRKKFTAQPWDERIAEVKKNKEK